MDFYTHGQLDNFCKILESKGYRRFDVLPGSIDYEKYNFLYKNWVTDDVGKRYSINIRFYSFGQNDYLHSNFPKWSCDAYLYLKTYDLATNIATSEDEYGVAWVTFECNSIESVEQFAEKMFKNLNGCYYERWNEC